ncbi:MAG TPA: DUF4402 domain-containing protein [Sphingomicrobium sp.]|nr:DUF4402 domain-containing protein [Sphingomicrobium sp.]
MTGLSIVRGAAASLPLLLSAAAVGAPVPATRNATADASILRPLTILKQSDMDFGELVVRGAGTAVIDPLSGGLTTTGLVTHVGPAARAAVFTTTGSRTSNVHIRLPQNPITLTRVGGTQTMTVSSWTLDGNSNRKFPLTAAFNFAVGATLTIAAGQADGTYLGNFDVTVQYP